VRSNRYAFAPTPIAFAVRRSAKLVFSGIGIRKQIFGKTLSRIPPNNWDASFFECLYQAINGTRWNFDESERSSDPRRKQKISCRLIFESRSLNPVISAKQITDSNFQFYDRAFINLIIRFWERTSPEDYILTRSRSPIAASETDLCVVSHC